MNHKLIILYGPTAVGKTDLSYQINDLTPIEIINGDVGQFYEPLAIGTAKPDWKKHPLPHHLFDYCKNPKDITVVEYRDVVLKTVQDVWSRGAIPVLVGGSGFYLKSLFFPPKNVMKSSIGSLVDSDKLPHQAMPAPDELWNFVHTHDPERAVSINPNDHYRLERAAQLIQRGVQPSAQNPEYVPFSAEVLFVALTRDREELYDRINQRTNIMLANGWIEEVKQLSTSPVSTQPWIPFLLRKKIIGYDDIIRYLYVDPAFDHLMPTKDALIATIQQKTRRYAKRQLTFLRMLEKLMRSHLHKPSRMVTIAQDHEQLLIKEVKDFLHTPTCL